MRTIGIIQARLGSSRLPNKMLLSLHGKPIIEWVVKRLKKSELLDGIIIAIPDTKKDNVLEYYLNKLNVKVFRGSESNVLNRFHEAVKNEKADNIVRVCADNPLICGKEIDNLIKFYLENRCDYAYNHIPKNNLYPDGLGAEIVSFELLNWLNENVKEEEHKEHCFSYIWDNQDEFLIKTFNPKKELQYPNIKLDVDTFDDYCKLALSPVEIDMKAEEIIRIFKDEK